MQVVQSCVLCTCGDSREPRALHEDVLELGARFFVKCPIYFSLVTGRTLSIPEDGRTLESASNELLVL